VVCFFKVGVLMELIINEDNLNNNEVQEFSTKVRAILFDENNRILIANYGNVILLPGGKVDDGETNLIRPRHTITIYYYIKTNQKINAANMNLTEGEIKENFKISFVDKDKLFKMLLEKHKDAMIWQIFYEENQVVVEHILKK